MPFEVVHDGTGRGDPMENCALCRGKTRFWFVPKDVAVCPSCAETRSSHEVPTKRKWIDFERAATSPDLKASQRPTVSSETNPLEGKVAK